MSVILKAENISKQYRLGLVGSSTIKDDVKRLWANVRGQEDPFLKIGDTNDRSVKGTGDYVWALKNINFEVQQGEVLGIIGKNGAGKSTLLKLLSRVTAPTTGSIKTKGRIASLLEVGTGFHPELTGRENVFLNGAILGMTKPEITSKLDEIVDFSGCERYIDTPTKRYSSGMTVRLAFAVAAHLEPEILVVDEVLAVGDAEFQKKAIGKMQDISKGEGRTVIFVSHNMVAVRNLCTRAMSLESGVIKFTGDTDLVVSDYLKTDNKKTKIASRFLKKIELLSSFSDNRLTIGSDLILEIGFCNDFYELVDYCFLGIYDEDDTRVASVSTAHDYKFEPENLRGKVLQCTIPHINLTAGNYRVMIAIGSSLPQQNLEVIESVMQLEIIDKNFFRNGTSLGKDQGMLVLKSVWDIL